MQLHHQLCRHHLGMSNQIITIAIHVTIIIIIVINIIIMIIIVIIIIVRVSMTNLVEILTKQPRANQNQPLPLVQI